jgi:hypothetical protein
MKMYEEGVEPVYEHHILVVELDDGSRLILRDDTYHDNSVSISAAGNASKRLGISEGIAIVPGAANTVEIFITPLGSPTSIKDGMVEKDPWEGK